MELVPENAGVTVGCEAVGPASKTAAIQA